MVSGLKHGRMGRMNITMIVLNHFTHDARIQREAKTLSRAGHRVRVVALHKAGIATDEQLDGFRVSRLVLKSSRWRGGKIAPIPKYAEFMIQLARTTRSEPADVYHSHDGNTLLATFPIVGRDRAAWIYDSHELESGRNFGDSHLARAYQQLWPLPERLLIRHVDAVISASPSYADELRRLYNIVRPTVIANCPEYVPPMESTILQKRFRIPPDHTVLVYQGGVMRNRGIEVAIKSLEYLEPEFHLVILGGGPALGEFQHLAAQLGLLDRVHFAGHIPLAELPSHTASAHLGLTLIQNSCSSYYHTLPNKIFEYIMAGIPVVASDFPAMAQVIREHQVGEVVQDPTSPGEVAEAIRRVMSDRDAHDQLRANAHRAARVLNWETEQEHLLDLYRSLADRSRG